MLWRLLWFCFVFFFLSSRTVVVLFCFPRCMPVFAHFSHFSHFPRHCFFYSRIAPHRRSKGNIVRRMCGGRFASIDVVSTAFSVTGAVAVTASEAGQIHREWEGLVLPLRSWAGDAGRCGILAGGCMLRSEPFYCHNSTSALHR